MSVHRIGRIPPGRLPVQVGDDLVAEEIEVDPPLVAATFGTSQDPAIEGAGGLEVVHGKGEMKWRGVHSIGRALGGSDEIVSNDLLF